ncbi:MAG: glycosyltransferase family 4 protein [Euzebyales bacterium]|nr:glycosyltransferase family 4 protein [Euzebyales bacterium]
MGPSSNAPNRTRRIARSTWGCLGAGSAVCPPMRGRWPTSRPGASWSTSPRRHSGPRWRRVAAAGPAPAARRLPRPVSAPRTWSGTAASSISELGLRRRGDVHRHGAGRQRAAYLSTAALGVVPDLRTPYSDQSTLTKVMEYMAFGLPVVAFDLRESRVSAQDAAVFVASGWAERAAPVWPPSYRGRTRSPLTSRSTSGCWRWRRAESCVRRRRNQQRSHVPEPGASVTLR